jgi:hypothetical protein
MDGWMDGWRESEFVYAKFVNRLLVYWGYFCFNWQRILTISCFTIRRFWISKCGWSLPDVSQGPLSVGATRNLTTGHTAERSLTTLLSDHILTTTSSHSHKLQPTTYATIQVFPQASYPPSCGLPVDSTLTPLCVRVVLISSLGPEAGCLLSALSSP